jgi:hypothetical protein
VIATIAQQNVSGFSVLSNGEIRLYNISFQDMSDFNSGIVVSVECSIQITNCTFSNMSNFNNFIIAPISAGYFYFSDCTLDNLDTNHYFIQIQSKDVMLSNVIVNNSNLQGLIFSIQRDVSSIDLRSLLIISSCTSLLSSLIIITTTYISMIVHIITITIIIP